jgi:lysine N6-hydroxylase
MPGDPQILDLAGIGIGPFNLSVAAQLDSVPEIRAAFFDKRERFNWHPGMMLDDVKLQTSFLKDLVTATNPTSRWSFLSYLVAHKRFYEFMNAEFDAIPRKEFAKYLAWAANGLNSLRFGSCVHEVSITRNAFEICTNMGRHQARNIALGIGLQPFVPAFANPLLGQACFHAVQAVPRLAEGVGDRIVVIGGGQSGAEIMLHLLCDKACATKQITWVSRRPNFEPLDATPFTNEFFTPDYVKSFRGLGEERRHMLLAQQKLASDGISASTLRALYRRLYVLRNLEDSNLDVSLMPNREVIEADRRKTNFSS